MKSLIQKSSPLRTQVYEAVLALLRNGSYAPGLRLTEGRIANDLSVSRTPVREALSQLHRDGLVEVRKRGGYVVPSPSRKEIADTFEVRRILEPFAIASLARQVSADQLAAIKTAIDQEATSANIESPDAFASANEAFRSALFDHLDNAKLRDVISQFGNHLQFIRLLTLKDPGIRKRIVRAQRAIYDALKNGDSDQAQRLWIDYLAFAEQALGEAMEREAIGVTP